MTTTALPLRRTGALLLVAVATSIAGFLSGCVAEPDPDRPTDGASTSTDPSEVLPPSEQPDLGEPGPACGDILSAADVYAYNPNMSAVAAPPPADGPMAEAARLDGTVCRWSNGTSNIGLDVAVAVPGESELADRAAAAESGATPTDAFGAAPDVTAYFDMDGDIGTVQVFAKGRWIVLSSPMFVEATDVEPLVTAILANLGDAA